MQWTEAIKNYIEVLKPIEKNVPLIQRMLSLMDFTSLNDTDTEQNIETFFKKAQTPYGPVAAVCIYPSFLRMAINTFAHTPIKVATVANFPKGDHSLETVMIEIGRALSDGAQEIDVVFPYHRYLAGERQYARTFVESCKAACGDEVTLKVILETGALGDLAIIADASFEVLSAGADFIKTSTGKMNEGATLQAAATMLLVIKHMQSQLKRPLGFKASGGIREFSQAVLYLELAEQILGREWVTPQTFRIGASKLIDEMLVL